MFITFKLDITKNFEFKFCDQYKLKTLNVF